MNDKQSTIMTRPVRRTSSPFIGWSKSWTAAVIVVMSLSSMIRVGVVYGDQEVSTTPLTSAPTLVDVDAPTTPPPVPFGPTGTAEPSAAISPTAAPIRMTPENDRCVDATTLEPFVPVNGDNTDANFDFINQGVCGPRSDRRALWYEIIGAGKNTTVYVCTNNGKITDFGVFQVCNTQLCEGAPPQLMEPANCQDDEANTFSFFAENGEDYFVHVRSDTLDPEGSNFTIWYEQPTDEPSSAPSSAPPSSTSGIAFGSWTHFGIVVLTAMISLMVSNIFP